MITIKGKIKINFIEPGPSRGKRVPATVTRATGQFHHGGLGPADFHVNFAYHRPNSTHYDSDSEEDDEDLSSNFDRLLNETERNINLSNGNENRPRRDLSPLNLSTPQKQAWNQVRATRNKIAEHTAFKAFLTKCKERLLFPDIVNIRRPPPGIFSRAPKLGTPNSNLSGMTVLKLAISPYWIQALTCPPSNWSF